MIRVCSFTVIFFVCGLLESVAQMPSAFEEGQNPILKDVAPLFPNTSGRFNFPLFYERNKMQQQNSQYRGVLNQKPNPRQIPIQQRNRVMNYQPPVAPSGDALQRHQQVIRQSQRNRALETIEEIRKEERSNVRHSYYDLPQYSSMTHHYQSAFDELVKLLDSDQERKMLRSTYLVENAYFDGGLDFDLFKENIDEAAKLVSLYVAQSGYSVDNPLAINWGLYKYMSDTIEINLIMEEQTYTHLPMKYDFDDFFGDKDYGKTFVSKLMVSNTGQCRSMPLRGLLIAETLGADFKLSLAPNHYYLQFSDTEGNWFNFETTRGRLASDAWIQSSVKNFDALRSKSYMKRLSKEEEIALCMLDLVEGYLQKFSVADGEFVLNCIDSALAVFEQHHHNCIRGHLLKWNVYNRLIQEKKMLYQLPEDQLESRFQEIGDWKRKLEEIEKELKVLGYEPMNEEEYQRWLETIEKYKSENKENYNLILNSLK